MSCLYWEESVYMLLEPLWNWYGKVEIAPICVRKIIVRLEETGSLMIHETTSGLQFLDSLHIHKAASASIMRSLASIISGIVNISETRFRRYSPKSSKEIFLTL